jgi:hypothetical protein
MGTDSCSITGASLNYTYTTPETPQDNRMTRKRLVELTKLAQETVDMLERKGVTAEEACTFGTICDRMFNQCKGGKK